MGERDDCEGAVGMVESAVCAFGCELGVVRGHCCRECQVRIGDVEVEYLGASVPWAWGPRWRKNPGRWTCG